MEDATKVDSLGVLGSGDRELRLHKVESLLGGLKVK